MRHVLNVRVLRRDYPDWDWHPRRIDFGSIEYRGRLGARDVIVRRAVSLHARECAVGDWYVYDGCQVALLYRDWAG
jgi:hypothetical protein